MIKVDVKAEPIQQVHEQKSQQLHANMTCTFLCIAVIVLFKTCYFTLSKLS